MLLYWILCTPLFILAGICITLAILDYNSYRNKNIKLWKAILPGILFFCILYML